MTATDSTSDNGNGRITLADRLARIEEKLDRALSEQYRLASCGDEHDKRIGLLEQGASRREEQIASLRENVRGWSAVNSLGAVLAMIMAYFGITK